MQIARSSVERPLYTWLLILFCLFGGIAGYLAVGKLEDPVFTLKTALVITPYPGATAAEVALEVSERLESEIQKMDEVDFVTSRNTPGLSVITVTIEDTYDGSELPQVWDHLRRRIADAGSSLPAGSGPPEVNDSFGDVYGLLYAVTAPGYSDAEIHEIATFLRREVLAVPGVADAELTGLPEEAIFIEPSSRALVNLGVPPDVILGAVSRAGAVTPTGAARDGERNVRIDAPASDNSVSRLAALSFGFDGRSLNLVDLASVSRGRVADPRHVVRHDGVEAFTLGIAGLTSENIVAVGARIEARLAELASLLPVGVGIHPIYEQHRVVDAANASFVESLAISVGVVVGVLALFMGWRAAVVVGGSLFATVMATFPFMALFAIEVERISLGALIIAMGMLVDNAIVVADGMQVEMRKGRRAADAAAEVARRTQVPLLGATIIGIMAFAGIGLSPDASGEFLFSLFAVIGLSLLLSWLIAATVTPLLASYLFRVGDAAPGEAYDGRFFRAYAALVRGTLRARALVVVGLVGGTIACFGAFAGVKQQFFPPADTPLFYLDYMAAQGTRIGATLRDLAVLESWLAAREDVEAVTTTAGRGATRFLLTYEPAQPDPSWGQLIVRASSPAAIPALRDDLAAFAREALPWAETRVQQIIYGPPTSADVEVRFSGPDPDVLRAIAEEARSVFETRSAGLQTERIDWRERELVTRPVLATDRAQALGIDRADVARTLATATDGIEAGIVRERDRSIPVVVRTPREEVLGDGALLDRLVWSPTAEGFVPLAQVLDGFDVASRDTLIHRRDRVPTVSVQAYAVPGVLPPQAFAEVRPHIEAIPLPPGYRMEWGGEYESASTAQASLARQMPLSFGVMLLITLLLFGKLRQTAVIWTIVPMAVNGVALGLLLTGLPFSFTALLGLLSLSGMLIKNAIVLVEEIDRLKEEERLQQSEAIVTASVSRLRPVTLAAVTTILGMAPLLWDGFFASMAVTIMAGLGFASILTLVGVPALYHTYLRRERRAERESVGTPALARDPAIAHPVRPEPIAAE